MKQARGGKQAGKQRGRQRRRSEKRRKQREPYLSPKMMAEIATAYPEMRADILAHLQQETYRSQTAEEIAAALGYDQEQAALVACLQTLRQLEQEFAVVQTKKKRYVLPEQAGYFRGQYLANAKGFGFVRLEQEGCPDVYIHKKRRNTAMHKDKVLIHLFDDPRLLQQPAAEFRPEGEVVQVLERANAQVVGTLALLGREWVVYPDEKRLPYAITVSAREAAEAEPGDKVVVQIQQFANRHHTPFGKIIKVLGPQEAAGVDMQGVLWQFGIAEDFPAEVLAAAEKAAQPITVKDRQDRRDLRQQPIITIDGSDAKDLDDAVSCNRLENGNYQLHVHIADVGHYVPVGSVLDQEAFRRGTSVYLPDRVMPMLPRALSNHICSLNAGEDRLAMSCSMEITPRGKIESYEIYPSVIRVGQRFSYDVVNQMLLEEDAAALAQYGSWLGMLQTLAKLQQILEKKRHRRGAIHFDLPETKIIMSADNSKVVDVVKRQSRLAEKIIEECMIVTNEVVATEFHRRKIPFIYRVHQGPGEAKLSQFREAAEPLGYTLTISKQGLKPKALQQLLSEAEGKPESAFLQLLALRSMSHAFYSPEALGHFGLASRYYSHFTSPIRRYADLAIHRVIKDYLQTAPSGAEKKKLAARMTESAQQASQQERMAEEAEREAVQIKCCQFMQDKIGQTFTGVISGVASYGVFVELPNSIEGRVALADLPPDDYRYLAGQMMLKGSKHCYRLGDTVQITVAAVHLAEKEIDFHLVAEE